MIDFTKNKFLSLPQERQHRKCSELLRIIYESRELEDRAALLQRYNQWALWINEPSIEDTHLKALSDRYHHHLNLAHVYKKEHSLLPHIRKGDKTTSKPSWEIDVYLDHLRSAHNVGSIVRTAEAFGFGNLYFSEQCPDLNHKQVKDAAMGAEQWVSSKRINDQCSLIEPIIALETSEEAISIYDFIFPDSFTLVVGNEEYGCSDPMLKRAHLLIEIPLRGRKNSLNVANAFAIVAGEIQRQKLRIQHEQNIER